jgi:CheY-like chemotaxis protein
MGMSEWNPFQVKAADSGSNCPSHEQDHQGESRKLEAKRSAPGDGAVLWGILGLNEKQTILLVDDSDDDLVIMRIAFKKAEFVASFQEVHNGQEAIAYLNGEGPFIDRDKFPLPAIMLLDLNMPMKSGFDVLKWVRAQPVLKRMAIIILTASMRLEDVERAYDLGANSYLVKPGGMEELTAMIRCLRDWIKLNHFPPLNATVKRRA